MAPLDSCILDLAPFNSCTVSTPSDLCRLGLASSEICTYIHKDDLCSFDLALSDFSTGSNGANWFIYSFNLAASYFIHSRFHISRLLCWIDLAPSGLCSFEWHHLICVVSNWHQLIFVHSQNDTSEFMHIRDLAPSDLCTCYNGTILFLRIAPFLQTSFSSIRAIYKNVWRWYK